MADLAYDDPELAAVYDALNPWGPSEDFYLGLIRSAGAVLDIGCGTGRLLAAARAAGHTGRLVGRDPGAGMLAVARTHPGIEWQSGSMIDPDEPPRYDLITMTGHAFQTLLDLSAQRIVLRGARCALRPGGRLAFETRNPQVRPWERWTADVATITGADGSAVHVRRDLVSVRAEIAEFTETFTADPWPEPKVSRSLLRFSSAGEIDRRLTANRFAVDERYGDWDRSLFTADSPEIITVASVT